MDNNLQETLNALKGAYLIKLKDQLAEFKGYLSDWSQDHFAELYQKVHKISGTSGMYGFLELSEKSTEFERYLMAVQKQMEQMDSEEILSKLEEYILLIERLV